MKTTTPTNFQASTRCIVLPKAVVFVTIEHDQDCENPCEEGACNGTILSFNRKHINFKPDEINKAIKADLKRKYRRVLPLSYFEHGNSLWDVQGGPIISTCPDMRWDGVQFAGVWIADADLSKMALQQAKEELPKTATHQQLVAAYDQKLRAIAIPVCQEYTAWCNGECYAITVKAYKPIVNLDQQVSEELAVYEELGEELANDSSCGFIGDESIKCMAEDVVQPVIDTLLEDKPVTQGVPI